ncbi:STAS domain-containing protein [Thalassobacillus sp. CUG 92003]|uniref:STAS domain-containing protein n=1 Tax=Thalassobacillus sp. CUG 92003 TaxID=2736641 RepID=UPI002105E395|nr:STAS domain-containing protein [Thalassobacillus sp. CUG 92003]
MVDHYFSEVNRLSTPIVPVAENISVLPLVGTVDEERLHKILDVVSLHVNEAKEDYLIVDLSGIHSYSTDLHRGIYQLNQLLDLMGTTLILTGVKPHFAMESAPHVDFNELSLQSYTSVKQALQFIQ